VIIGNSSLIPSQHTVDVSKNRTQFFAAGHVVEEEFTMWDGDFHNWSLFLLEKRSGVRYFTDG
jgi:hypothetical protein